MTKIALYLPVGMALVGSMVAAVAGSDVQSASQVTITYLANEGIMVTSGDQSVLVDALFRGGVSGYELHEPAELEKIETAKPPYGGVDLVLVTHFHADHFDAGSVARHLANNKNAVLVTSEQVAKEVQKAAAHIAPIASRIRTRTPDVKDRETDESSGIRVDVLGLSHGGGRFEKVRNMGYVIHLGGKRILHVGDAQIDNACFEPMEQFAKGVDVACLPHWMVEHPTGVAFVRDVLKPKQLIVFHIMPRDAKRVVAKVTSDFPDAIFLTSRMMRHSF